LFLSNLSPWFVASCKQSQIPGMDRKIKNPPCRLAVGGFWATVEAWLDSPRYTPAWRSPDSSTCTRGLEKFHSFVQLNARSRIRSNRTSLELLAKPCQPRKSRNSMQGDRVSSAPRINLVLRFPVAGASAAGCLARRSGLCKANSGIQSLPSENICGTFPS
jgi:hypothetical protein